MRRLGQLLRQTELHIFLFCLLFSLTNWPFLAVPGKSGLMSMMRYLFVLWAVLIIVLFLVQRTLRGASGNDGDDKGGD